jgi:uncharacterized protein YqfA (UPF0365 family)
MNTAPLDARLRLVAIEAIETCACALRYSNRATLPVSCIRSLDYDLVGAVVPLLDGAGTMDTPRVVNVSQVAAVVDRIVRGEVQASPAIRETIARAVDGAGALPLDAAEYVMRVALGLD